MVTFVNCQRGQLALVVVSPLSPGLLFRPMALATTLCWAALAAVSSVWCTGQLSHPHRAEVVIVVAISLSLARIGASDARLWLCGFGCKVRCKVAFIPLKGHW